MKAVKAHILKHMKIMMKKSPSSCKKIFNKHIFSILAIVSLQFTCTNIQAQSITEGFEGSVPNTGWTITTPGAKAWDKSSIGNGYTGSYALRCGNTVGADSTWLFTPVQNLTAGTTYSFNFWIRVSAYTTPQKLKITVGNAATIAGQLTTLWNCNNGTALTSNCWEWVNCRFTPPVTGTYYFALCCYSASNTGYLYVDDVKLEAGCSSPLSGSVNVGSGQTYTTLTSAGGLFQKINSCGLSGNLTVNITSDLTESGTYCISDWKNTAYSVTVQPDAAIVRTISGSNAFGLIRINGADKVIFNGNYAGNGPYLCLRNTNISSASSKVIGFRENSANCAIRNCRIVNGYFGIHQSDQSDAYNTIANCSIEDFSSIGILLYGGNNTTISANTIFQTTRSTQPGGVWGILTNNATSLLIEKNKIYNLIPYLSSDPDPAWCDFYDAIGIDITSLTGGVAVTAIIRNNMIILEEHSASWLKGIVFSANIAGSSCDAGFNSIYIGGSTLNASEYTSGGSGNFHTPVSYCIYKSNGYTFNCYNNLMYNNRTSTVAARKNYAMYVSNSSNVSSDYNDLYAPQTNGYVGLWTATDYATLAAWRTASGKDANSFNQDPGFSAISPAPYDLHLQPAAGLTGNLCCSVTDDYDNQPRIIPYIGADELPNPLPVSLINFHAQCENGTALIEWATASETNNDYFTLERNSDNKNWHIIAKVPGTGNSNSLHNYSFTENEASNGLNYYRLAQTDFDGLSKTFPLVSLDCSESEEPAIVLYPNPFNDVLTLQFINLNSDEAIIDIIDVLGRNEKHITLNNKNLQNNTLSIDLNMLGSGCYFLKFTCGETIVVKQLIKK